ncbi:hypothetical protein CAPTEDRAFT_222696 [Capitella teleta]|uniref:Transporter n=1 Tax=Capitella teleta TaxID=283909 RepID=R7VCD9_CAPTE|nr:hypothetical protein CAPTEDRAFT_222696 [Capitella teleta]|eukprot:ELU16289.1 hypothetical protein CAPTEDRAFT_222696 [Capitella teleta]
MAATSDSVAEDELKSRSDQKESPERAQWNKQCDFFLCCVGYAVGIGNLWRFPYLCMRNGGGAFLIPYFIFLLLCGIPLFFMELSLGQFSSLSPLSVWKINPLFKGLGFGMVLVSGIVCIYYNVIMAWALYYVYATFRTIGTGQVPWDSCGNWWNTDRCLRRSGGLTETLFNVTTTDISAAVNSTKKMTPTEEFWQYNVLRMSSGIDEVGGMRWELLICLFIAWLMVFACICKGVKSTGKVVYFTATMPYLMLIVMLGRGLSLPGAWDGIYYYLKPDFTKLAQLQVWAEACSQIFYSLGPAYGGLITMASFNKFSNNCYRDAIVIPCINCGTSFLAGFVVFSVVGFMAAEAGLKVDEVVVSGPGLAFVVYPEALSLLPVAPVWAILFFLMLIIMGLDTQFGMFETMTSGFVDEFPRYLKGRETLFTGFMCLLSFLLGVPIVTQCGVYIFQIMDWYSACFSLITISFLECLAVGWIYGSNNLLSDITFMIGYRPCAWWSVCWRVITPVSLLSVLVMTMVRFTPPTYGDYIYPPWAIFLGWVFALCSLIPIPAVMIFRILRAKGTLTERIRHLLQPARDWDLRVAFALLGWRCIL